MAVGLSLGARTHPEKHLTSSSPSAVAPLEKGVGRGDHDFRFQISTLRYTQMERGL